MERLLHPLLSFCLTWNAIICVLVSLAPFCSSPHLNKVSYWDIDIGFTHPCSPAPRTRWATTEDVHVIHLVIPFQLEFFKCMLFNWIENTPPPHTNVCHLTMKWKRKSKEIYYPSKIFLLHLILNVFELTHLWGTQFLLLLCICGCMLELGTICEANFSNT